MTRHDEALPTRSADGLAALDVFYSEFNEINFYVEDADQENLYEVILRRLFPGVKVDRIFPLGGKDAVLRHASSSANENLPAFRAYILDKDFDDLLEKKVTHPNVFYLDRFCIENYLLDENAFVEIVIESLPRKHRQDVETTLNLRLVIEATFASLRALFVCFACVQRFELGLQNCGCAPEMYCRKKRLWECNPTALAKYINQVVAAGIKAAINPPIVDPITDTRMLDALEMEDHKLVSGKHVAAMLFHYIKSKFTIGTITFDSFLFRLAKNGSLDSLHDLVPNIVRGVNTFNSGTR